MSNAKRILADIGIAPAETHFRAPIPNCHSVRLELPTYPGMSVAGKGTSLEWARASAYGELLEYIQNRAFPEILYGLMPAQQTVFPDQASSTFSEAWLRIRPVLECLVESPVETSPIASAPKMDLVPWLCVETGEVEFLPMRLVHLACGSNGMCAGNTPAEALVHGICEMMEHFVVKQIYMHNQFRFPTIPDSTITAHESYVLVEEARQAGYRVILKDCTLGGLYPVLGMILLHAESGSYRVKFAADPSFDIALQRCVTEAFQGIGSNASPSSWMNKLDYRTPYYTEGPFDSPDKNRLVEYHKTMTFGTGVLPYEILFAEGTPAFENAFVDGDQSNESALSYLRQRLEQADKRLYVRDVSFLGFPTFRVYVPGMSEWHKLTHDRLRFDYAQLRRCLLTLTEASADDIRTCVDLVEQARNEFPDFYVQPSDMVRQWACVRFKEVSDFDRFSNVDLLLTLLYSRLGAHAGAVGALRRYLDSEPTVKNRDYFVAALTYFRLMADGREVAETVVELETLFGAEMSAEIVNDLAKPGKALDDWVLPLCGECETCPVNSACCYAEWEDVTSRLTTAMAASTIDQRGLATLFR